METTNYIWDLTKTIEQLRDEKYPNLPAALIAQLLETEAYFLENQPEASKRIGQQVEKYLNEEEK